MVAFLSYIKAYFDFKAEKSQSCRDQMIFELVIFIGRYQMYLLSVLSLLVFLCALASTNNQITRKSSMCVNIYTACFVAFKSTIGWPGRTCVCVYLKLVFTQREPKSLYYHIENAHNKNAWWNDTYDKFSRFHLLMQKTLRKNQITGYIHRPFHT